LIAADPVVTASAALLIAADPVVIASAALACCDGRYSCYTTASPVL
jgi:predicted membrane-bound dolichyl-phosphate-mannose-protein mannosyltransferase